MKNLTIFLVAAMSIAINSCGTKTQKESYEGDLKTIENPMTGESILIAKSDFSNTMSWAEANKACEDLGNGWRLPTKIELNEMKKNKDVIGGFGEVSYYWSSTQTGNGHFERIQFVSDDIEILIDNNNENSKCRVRAVKNL